MLIEMWKYTIRRLEKRYHGTDRIEVEVESSSEDVQFHYLPF